MRPGTACCRSGTRGGRVLTSVEILELDRERASCYGKLRAEANATRHFNKPKPATDSAVQKTASTPCGGPGTATAPPPGARSRESETSVTGSGNRPPLPSAGDTAATTRWNATATCSAVSRTAFWGCGLPGRSATPSVSSRERRRADEAYDNRGSVAGNSASWWRRAGIARACAARWTAFRGRGASGRCATPLADSVTGQGRGSWISRSVTESHAKSQFRQIIKDVSDMSMSTVR